MGGRLAIVGVLIGVVGIALSVYFWSNPHPVGLEQGSLHSPAAEQSLNERPAPHAEIEVAALVANATRKEDLRKETRASKGDLVWFHVYYYNRENEDSGRDAKALTVRIDAPTYGLGPEVWSATVWGLNTNRETDGALIRIPKSLYLEFVPGSATWRHNQGTDAAPDWVTSRVNDQIVGEGVTLEDAQPCLACEASVRIALWVKVNRPR